MKDVSPPAGAAPLYPAPSSSAPDRLLTALLDIRDGFARRELWMTLAWESLRKRYHGTFFGMAWSILSFALFVSIFVFVFSELRNVDPTTYPVHVASGWLAWGLLSSTISGGPNVLARASSWIASTALPYTVFAYRDLWTEIILAAAAIPVVVIVVLWKLGGFLPIALLAAPGFLISAVFGFFVMVFLGVISLRLRDLAFFVEVSMRLAFFLTPIIWTYNPDSTEPRDLLARLNPLTHMVEIVRLPLMGVAPSPVNYAVALGAMTIAAILAVLALAAFRRRIPLWI